MGIPEFLSRVLESAGRSMDLRDYAGSGILKKTSSSNSSTSNSNNKRRRRPLKIGVDVSSWIYKAAHGFGDMLGDERHLTNYGRASLLLEQQEPQPQPPPNEHDYSRQRVQEYILACTNYVTKRIDILRDKSNADILIVLDGKTPPVKEREVQRRRQVRDEHVTAREEPVDVTMHHDSINARRTKAFKRAGAGKHFLQIVDALLDRFRESQTSFMIAPFEADSQLAYLSNQGYIDLIITEDSDLVAHGAKSILYKSVTEIGNGVPKGMLLQFSDLGASGLQLMDFTPVMMTILFVSVGCDYCDKLKGIGLLTAARVIRKAFLESQVEDPLGEVFSELYHYSYRTSFSKSFKQEYQERFLAAILVYRHPIVYDPVERQCVLVASDNQNNDHQNENDDDLFGDPALLRHKPYADLLGDFDRIQLIVGELPDAESATAAVEGRLKKRHKKNNDDSMVNNNNNNDDSMVNNNNNNNNNDAPPVVDTSNNNNTKNDVISAATNAITGIAVDSSDEEDPFGSWDKPMATDTEPDSFATMATQPQTAPAVQTASLELEPDSSATLLSFSSQQAENSQSSSPKKNAADSGGGQLIMSPLEQNTHHPSVADDEKEDSSDDGAVAAARSSPNHQIYNVGGANSSSQEEESPSKNNSPNLLCSTTPEKSVAASAAARSPNLLLASATPEQVEKTLSTLEQIVASASRSPNLLLCSTTSEEVEKTTLTSSSQDQTQTQQSGVSPSSVTNAAAAEKPLYDL